MKIKSMLTKNTSKMLAVILAVMVMLPMMLVFSTGSAYAYTIPSLPDGYSCFAQSSDYQDDVTNSVTFNSTFLGIGSDNILIVDSVKIKDKQGVYSTTLHEVNYEVTYNTTSYTITFTTPRNKDDIYVNYTVYKPGVNLTLDADGGTCNVTTNYKIAASEDVKIDTYLNQKYHVILSDCFSRTGYHYDNYLVNGQVSNAHVSVSADAVVKPNWVLNSYSVTVLGNGGSFADGTDSKTYTVDHGSSFSGINITTPTRSGYTFSGYSRSSSSSVAVGNITADTTVYARWIKKSTPTTTPSTPTTSTTPTTPTETTPTTPTETNPVERVYITFEGNGGVFPDVANAVSDIINIESGSSLISLDYNIPTRANFTFGGWSTSATSFKQVDMSKTITTDMTYYAFWVADEDISDDSVFVTYNPNGGSFADGVTNTKTVSISKSLRFTALDKPSVGRVGYKFVGWALQDSTVDPATWLFKQDTTLIAQWEYDGMVTFRNNVNGDIVEKQSILLKNEIKSKDFEKLIEYTGMDVNTYVVGFELPYKVKIAKDMANSLGLVYGADLTSFLFSVSSGIGNDIDPIVISNNLAMVLYEAGIDIFGFDINGKAFSGIENEEVVLVPLGSWDIWKTTYTLNGIFLLSCDVYDINVNYVANDVMEDNIERVETIVGEKIADSSKKEANVAITWLKDKTGIGKTSDIFPWNYDEDANIVKWVCFALFAIITIWLVISFIGAVLDQRWFKLVVVIILAILWIIILV